MTRILLVEDDVNLREIFQMRLIAEGYDTLTADNGEEGLVVAMKERPDLIISDVMMPKLSGFEMLETLRAAPEMANTKAVMMTALGQAEDRARGEKLGVIKYLVKSQVTLEDFVSVVREVVSPAPAANGTDTTAASNVNQVQTNPHKESEAPMPPADQSTNPAPTADNSGADNPISGVPADAAQQSTEQEQSSVQDQINSFVSSGDDTAATTAPAADSAAATPTDGGSTAASPTDSGSAFGGEPAAPAGGDGMSAPAADTTAPEPPASTEPPTEAPQPPASTGTL